MKIFGKRNGNSEVLVSKVLLVSQGFYNIPSANKRLNYENRFTTTTKVFTYSKGPETFERLRHSVIVKIVTILDST